MSRLFAPALGTAILGVLATSLSPGQAQASTTVCTAIFTPPSVAPGSPIFANLGATSPCPPPTVTVNLNTVGSGLASQQLGDVFTVDWLTGLGTNNFTRTSPSTVGIGALRDAGSGPTTQAFTLSYSQPVIDPYLFFSWIDNYSEYKFYNPVTLLQANGASLLGATVTSTGNNNQDSGFVVQLTGTSDTFNFDIVNYSSDNTVALFTTGPAGVVPPVPGPLPVAGLGIAYSLSLKLRRRIRN